MNPALANHLLQSTVFAAVAGMLTLLLRNNHARTRYWIWLAASMKFLVPFSLFVEIGHRVSWPSAPVLVPPRLAFVVDEISQPFFVPNAVPVATAPSIMPELLLAGWICGCAAVLFFWFLRWRRVAAVLRASVQVTEGREVSALRRMDSKTRLVFSSSQMEPGVFGIWRPVLSLPAGIAKHLGDAQLEAVFAHELCHVRRRDNLTAALHMLVEAIFWFHPLVWWIGTRLVEERERACDEEVVRSGSDPEVYAESILRICRLYLESPLVCAAGISGSDLGRRIEAIMTGSILSGLSFGKRLTLGVFGVLALCAPISIGILGASARHGHPRPPILTASRVSSPVEIAPQPRQLAQATDAPQHDPAPQRLEFEAASVKPLKMTPMEAFQAGHLDWHIDDALADFQGISLLNAVQYAWKVPQNQVMNAPEWMNSTLFDIQGKLPAGNTKAQVPAMLQSLLIDRFKLAVHRQSEIRPVYELTVGSKVKLTPSDAPNTDAAALKCKDDTGHRLCHGMTMEELAQILSALGARGAMSGFDWLIDRPVVDKTGLSGAFDFTLDYGRIAGPGGRRGDGPMAPLIRLSDSIEALGLKLQPAKHPFDVIVIDHVERVPTEN